MNDTTEDIRNQRLRAEIGFWLQDIGLEILNRDSKNLSRYFLRRPEGQTIVVQTYTSLSLRRDKAIKFTVNGLHQDREPWTYWFAFTAEGLPDICVFSLEDIKSRFLRKGKPVPKRTTITITRLISKENSLEKRQDELLGGYLNALQRRTRREYLHLGV